uniref:DnaJ homolog subfamily C member 1 n=1 Tax=Schistosoma mansoni TaxID=6183 RepID=A0A5K4FF38_SCHMA
MIIYIFCLALLCEKVSAWDSGELQMFDLVEEVKENFYDFLGVSQTADISEIKRAYRKLSSKLHPDKNPDDPTAEQKFRRLVGIYEVLKNPELRAKYDEVLINGLPSWRTPVFYFRKLRKMSNYELFGLFFGMATVIHYAALWGSVFEKRLTLEDQLSTSLKRHKARDRKLELINQEISDELQKIPGPGWFDLLPFAIVRWIYAIITFIPVFTEFINGKISEKLQERRELREEARILQEKREKLKADKQERKRRLVHEQTMFKEAVKEAGQSTLNSVLKDIPDIEIESSDDSKSEAKDPVSREWSEADRDNLVRAVIRYPGGVPGRWERIAESLGRSVPDVIRKAKSMSKELMSISRKNINPDEIPIFETNVNNFCGETDSEQSNSQSDESGEEQHSRKRLRKRLLRRKEPCVVNQTNGETQLNANNDLSSDVIIVDEPYISRKKLKQQKDQATFKSVEIKPVKSNDGWTKVEQQQLEVAIRSIGKGTPERWDRITECIPTRTKAEVMAHVKYLSTLVQQKH